MDQSLTYHSPTGADVDPSKVDGSTPAHQKASEDVRLMNAFLAGDDAAFEVLFDLHNHRLFLYAARMLGNPKQAEDVVQELWERVVCMRAEPRPVHNPSGFFLTIVRNLCLNLLKREKRAAPFDNKAAILHEQSNRREQGELESVVIESLDHLPMKYREVLVLNVYSGYDFEEIADMLDISVTTAWKRASRARQQLRETLLGYITHGSSANDKENNQ